MLCETKGEPGPKGDYGEAGKDGLPGLKGEIGDPGLPGPVVRKYILLTVFTQLDRLSVIYILQFEQQYMENPFFECY